jgi:hypothetical protein
MHKNCTGSKKIFVCAYRDLKVKAFVSSCGTTVSSVYRSIEDVNGGSVTINRPEVVEEYETHKSRYTINIEKKEIVIAFF